MLRSKMLGKLMLHKTLLSMGIALGLTWGLAAGVQAQAVGNVAAAEATPIAATTPAASAAISQTVPITLQVTIPGPTGVITVDVPVLLTLDIRIGLSQVSSPTLVITPSVTVVSEPTAEEPPAEEPTTEEPATEEPVTPATEEPVAVEPEPTATPLPPVATPTPEVTATPAILPTPTPSPAPVVSEPICPDPRSVITRPGVNQIVSGTFDVTGTASHRDFAYYKLEYALGADIDPSANFAFLTDGRSPVVEGTLATVDTTSLSNGVYTLKLSVVDATGNFPPPCTVTFSIAN